MSNDLISVPRTDLLMAMDELRQSGRGYPADLLKKALFSAPVGAEPVGLSLEVRTLGSYGKAFDLPGNRRAYTYDHQPGNVEASRLGTACQQAVASSAGDYIDRGLSLLKELQALGFGVFEVDSSRWHAAPVAAQPDLTQQTLDDVKAGIPARDAEIEALRKELETLQAAQAQPTGLVKQLCDALELAKTCHGAILMSDPPQEMWKARGVDRVISEALNAAQEQQPVSGADGLPIELRGIAEAIGNGGGFWRSCSGCHESNKGMATGPFSETIKCHLGVGCSECGGIGAIWDTTDYDAMADFMAAEYQQRTETTEPVGQGQLRDATKMVDTKGFVAGGYVSAQLREAVGVITSPSHYLDGQEFDPSQLFGNSGELPATQTQGMTLGQRIAHVGGRENAQGYVEFGSPVAVHALIQHVLRDFHRQGPVNLAPTQQDATLQAEVLDMVRMLEANEWTDHCGKSELGQRLEWAITALQNRIAELTKPSSQQDAGKVKAGLLSSLVKIVDAVIASDEEGLIEHSETIIEARAAIDAARKEPDQ